MLPPPPCKARSIIAGTANKPSDTGTRWRPSYKKAVPNVKRGSPVTTVNPTEESSSPTPPLINPLIMEPFPRTLINAKPIRITKTISLEVSAITMGYTANTIPKARNAAATPPNSEPITAAPMARAPWPFCVIGYPSNVVGTLDASPGMPINIAVMAPPVNPTEVNATISGMASIG